MTLWQKRYVQPLPGILKSTRVNLISGRCIAITNVEKRGIRWLTYLLSWLHQLVNGFVYLLKCTQSRICFFALLIAQGADNDARDFFNMMMRPLIIAYRFKQLARYLGTKGGGRPQHRLKSEAIELADRFFTENPTAPLSRGVQYISGIFVAKYSDPPAASTIRKWLISIYRSDK
ncbi:hypothetical protein H1X78_RS12595 [Escherichia coli]